jgi:hypothetical protein
MLRLVNMPLPLAGFGLELLELEAGRCGLSLAAFVERAAGWWVEEADPGRLSHRVPDFLNEGGERVGAKTVDVELSPEVWSALERSAEEQDAQLELVVLHAAMCYAVQQSG